MTAKNTPPSLRLLGPAYPRAGEPCFYRNEGGIGGRNGWSTDNLSERQRVAWDWLSKKDGRLSRAMSCRTNTLTRIYRGTYLMGLLLDAIFALRDTPGLPRLLSNTTASYFIENHGRHSRETYEIMGAVHEVLRLGHLTTPEDPILVIGYVETVFPPGGGATPSGKEQIEIDGVSQAGIAFEFKLSTNGLNKLDEKQKDQAQRYARLLKDGKIKGAQYHITAKEISPEVIQFLAETIPGVRIFHYDSLIDQAGQLNTQSQEIDTDFYLWDDKI